MPPKKPKRQPETIEYINSANLIDRWQICQKIGKVFYDDNVPSEILHDMLNVLKINSKKRQEVIEHLINP